MKFLKNIIRKQNKYARILTPLFLVGLLFDFAFAQDVLPRMPSGPKPKAPINELPIANTPTIGEIAGAIRLYQAKDYNGALSLATQLAQKGDANAMTLAGFIHERSLIKDANAQSAAEFYRRGAVMNNSDSMLGLGRLYSENRGGVTALEARGALEKALSSGRHEARLMLANILNSDNDNSDKARAYHLYKEEADNGNIEAAHLVALYLLDKEPQSQTELIEAGKYLKAAAGGNIPQAQALYGVYLYLGTDGNKNFKDAAKWFQKAAQNGDPDGMFYWALVNAKAEGVPRNLEIAYEFAAKAKDIVGENQAAANRLWQQLGEIRTRQNSTNIQNNEAKAQTATSAPKSKTAKRRKRR